MLIVKVAALEAYKRIAEARLQEYESINRSLQHELFASKASNATMNDCSEEDVENMKDEVFLNLLSKNFNDISGNGSVHQWNNLDYPLTPPPFCTVHRSLEKGTGNETPKNGRSSCRFPRKRPQNDVSLRLVS